MSAQREERSVDLVGELRSRWPVLVAIIVMWIALWGQVSVANILGGALVAVAVLVLARSIRPRPVEHFSFEPTVRYLWTFAGQLVVATWEVIKAVVRPDTIRPGILAMRLEHASDAVVTLVANSITLTPGTLTLETERHDGVAVLYVHALDLGDEAGVRRDVTALEKLAVDAFAGPEAQAVQAQVLEDAEEADPALSEDDRSDGHATGDTTERDHADDAGTASDAGTARDAGTAGDAETAGDANTAARGDDAGTAGDADTAARADDADRAEEDPT